jgi:hypothetical protein
LRASTPAPATRFHKATNRTARALKKLLKNFGFASVVLGVAPWKVKNHLDRRVAQATTDRSNGRELSKVWRLSSSKLFS